MNLRNNSAKLAALLVAIAILLCLKLFTGKVDIDASEHILENTGFRVVSYNVENLYDTENNPKTKDDDLTPEGNLHWTEKRYTKKLNDISQVLHSVGGGQMPAIVGLCEIENDAVLLDLLKKTELKDKNYKYIITKSRDFRGANVALLYQPSLLKIIKEQSYRPNIGDAKPKYARDLLHVTASIANGDTLDLFVCHFPSRGGGVAKTRPYRIRTAEVLKEKADKVFATRGKANIIIMGDFNDYPEDESIRKVLEAASINAEKAKNSLHNMFLHKSNDTNMGSYKYKGKWKFIDQFIVSSNLLNSEQTKIRDSEAHIYSANYLMEEDYKYGGEKPFRTYVGFKYLGGVSDHLPIYLDLEVK